MSVGSAIVNGMVTAATPITRPGMMLVPRFDDSGFLAAADMRFLAAADMRFTEDDHSWTFEVGLPDWTELSEGDIFTWFMILYEYLSDEGMGETARVCRFLAANSGMFKEPLDFVVSAGDLVDIEAAYDALGVSDTHEVVMRETVHIDGTVERVDSVVFLRYASGRVVAYDIEKEAGSVNLVSCEPYAGVSMDLAAVGDGLARGFPEQVAAIVRNPETMAWLRENAGAEQVEEMLLVHHLTS